MLASVLLADWMKLCAYIVVVCILCLLSPKLLFMIVQSMAACFRLQNVHEPLVSCACNHFGLGLIWSEDNVC
jgi:hypothetical protein